VLSLKKLYKKSYCSSINLKFFKRSERQQMFNRKFKYLIFDKGSTIPSCFKNCIFSVHKGNNYTIIKINKYLVGFKFGAFCITRKRANLAYLLLIEQAILCFDHLFGMIN